MKYLIGADPEVFVGSRDTGAFVNGHGLIPGSKTNPHPVYLGAVQVDGMALEFNIDPAKNVTEFIRNIESVQTQLEKMLKPSGLCLRSEPVARFDPDYFKKQPEESKIMGCDPDFNAWTMSQNESPVGDRPFRTAAGHIHIGWTEGKDPMDYDHIVECAKIVRSLDCTMGIGTVLLDPDDTRRSLYGQAGAFRPKAYGLEYRVPSNFWLRSRGTTRWIYNTAIRTMKMAERGVFLENKDVVDIINTSNKEAAEELLPDNFLKGVANA